MGYNTLNKNEKPTVILQKSCQFVNTEGVIEWENYHFVITNEVIDSGRDPQ